MEAAHSLTKELTEIVNKKEGYVNIAISGGSSPSALFELWSDIYKDKIEWSKIRLFWVDERMVPATDKESNYGNAKRELLDKIPLTKEFIYRIKGESQPDKEAIRYSKQLLELLPTKEGFPIFDLVILGIGEDGHTSSIFPGQEYLLTHDAPYAPSVNPYSGQPRVAMTGKTILAAKKVMFYLNGASKQNIIDRLLEDKEWRVPAAYILAEGGRESLYFDK